MIEVETPEVSPIDAKTTVEKLTEHVGEYVETYLELTAVKATQKATMAATFGFTAVLISFFCMIVAIFLGFGLAAYFREIMTDKEAYFLVTAIYAVIAAIIIGFRKQLVFPFLHDKIVSSIYESKN